MSGYSEAQFISLVQKAEQEAQNNFRLYKTKIALFAMLGYTVIFAILFLLILLVGGTVGIAIVSSSLFLLLLKKKFIIVIIIAIWTFLRALWVKFEAPEGYELTAKEFPKLYKEINTLTKSLNALKVHKVLLTSELNAAVVQHPRLGVLGGQQNILIIGLQLLLTLSPQEMRSVLAHEFGHLSSNHGKFSGWIYRVRVTLMRIMYAFDSNDSFGARIMRYFFDWYAPRFSAYSFALARQNEFTADNIASQLTSADITAQALVNVHAMAPYIDERFWDKYFEQADLQEKPPTPPYRGLASFLKKERINNQELSSRIQSELKVETHYGDTHPSLKDRLDAIDAAKIVPQAIKINAAEAWLGDQYKPLMKRFDKEWMRSNKERWKDRYDYVRTAKNEMQEFNAKAVDELTDEQLWQLAIYTLEFDTEQNALHQFQQFLHRDPDSIGAHFYTGQILARMNDTAALDHLRKALKGEHTFHEAANLGYDLLSKQGQKERAKAWWEEVVAIGEELDRRHAERASVSHKDTFRKATIDPDLLTALTQQLKAHKNVKSAWIVEKVLEHKDNRPVYGIVFKPKGFSLGDYGDMTENIANALETDLDIFVVCEKGDGKKLSKKMKKAGEQIV